MTADLNRRLRTLATWDKAKLLDRAINELHDLARTDLTDAAVKLARWERAIGGDYPSTAAVLERAKAGLDEVSEAGVFREAVRGFIAVQRRRRTGMEQLRLAVRGSARAYQRWRWIARAYHADLRRLAEALDRELQVRRLHRELIGRCRTAFESVDPVCAVNLGLRLQLTERHDVDPGRRLHGQRRLLELLERIAQLEDERSHLAAHRDELRNELIAAGVEPSLLPASSDPRGLRAELEALEALRVARFRQAELVRARGSSEAEVELLRRPPFLQLRSS